MRNRQKGFSLIELLIVVAIILIIAAIAIPNLLRSRIAANEASAVGALRTINTAAVTYASTYGQGFPANLGTLGPVGGGGAATAANADLIDEVLAAGAKSGYNFVLTGGSADATGALNTYVVTAVPVTVGTTGQRGFCSDHSGVVRFDATGVAPAGAADTGCTAGAPLQ